MKAAALAGGVGMAHVGPVVLDRHSLKISPDRMAANSVACEKYIVLCPALMTAFGLLMVFPL